MMRTPTRIVSDRRGIIDLRAREGIILEGYDRRNHDGTARETVEGVAEEQTRGTVESSGVLEMDMLRNRAAVWMGQVAYPVTLYIIGSGALKLKFLGLTGQLFILPLITLKFLEKLIKGPILLLTWCCVW